MRKQQSQDVSSMPRRRIPASVMSGEQPFKARLQELRNMRMTSPSAGYEAVRSWPPKFIARDGWSAGASEIALAVRAFQQPNGNDTPGDPATPAVGLPDPSPGVTPVMMPPAPGQEGGE